MVELNDPEVRFQLKWFYDAFLRQPRVCLAICNMVSFLSTNSPSRSPQGCHLSILHSACICAWVCPSPGAWPCTWLCWTWWGLHRTTPPACQRPSGWHPIPPGCQLHHTVQCCLQSCWGCTQSDCPCHQQRCLRALVLIPTPEECLWSLVSNLDIKLLTTALSVTIQPIP